MKKILLIGAVLALSVLSFAQTAKTWAFGGVYRLKDHTFQSTVLAPPITHFDIGSLTAGVPDVPHASFVFDVGPFAGAAPNGTAYAGLYATHNFALTKDKRWSVDLGGVGYVANHRPFVTGFVAVLTVQLTGS